MKRRDFPCQGTPMVGGHNNKEAKTFRGRETCWLCQLSISNLLTLSVCAERGEEDERVKQSSD